jgi:hypothetical protein
LAFEISQLCGHRPIATDEEKAAGQNTTMATPVAIWSFVRFWS